MLETLTNSQDGIGITLAHSEDTDILLHQLNGLVESNPKNARGIRAFQDLVLHRCDEGHGELVGQDHEVSDLFKHNLPDDVAQAGSIERIRYATEVKVNLWRGEEVNLEKR